MTTDAHRHRLILGLSKYRIHTVSELTGLSPALIRAWESRYNLVNPARTPAGYRLYSDEDVATLRGAQWLLRRGMAPMQVAKLSGGEIRRAAGPDAGLSGPAVRLQLLSGTDGPAADALPVSYADRIERLIEAFAAFDSRLVEELLSPPLAMLPLPTLCEKLLIPLLHEVGDRWHRGALSIAAEHFGSGLVRKKLNTLLDTLRRFGGSRRLCCACPPGELHELGLLLFTLNAAAQGWDPIYLGADLPVAELALTVVRSQPELVGLSFIQQREPDELKAVLDEILHAVAGRCPVLVGGGGINGHAELVRTAGAVLMPESGRLDDLLPRHLRRAL